MLKCTQRRDAAPTDPHTTPDHGALRAITKARLCQVRPFPARRIRVSRRYCSDASSGFQFVRTRAASFMRYAWEEARLAGVPEDQCSTAKQSHWFHSAANSRLAN